MPFRLLPGSALSARLQMQLGGGWDFSPLPLGRLASPVLDGSLVAFLGEDGPGNGLMPMWPLFEEAASALAECIADTSRDSPPAVQDRLKNVVLRFLADISVNVRQIMSTAMELPQWQNTDICRSRPAALSHLRQHPLLSSLIRGMLLTQVSAFRLMTQRLETDREVLTSFGVPVTARLTAARPLGDLHERGAATLLEFDTGHRIMYKPRSVRLERWLARLFALIEADEPGLAPRAPASLDRGEYAWQEFVSATAPVTEAKITSYYKRVGALLACAYVMGARDLHYENVIFDGEAPVVVDPECFLTQATRTVDRDRGGRSDARLDNVLHLSILPSAQRLLGSKPYYDFTLLGFRLEPWQTGRSAVAPNFRGPSPFPDPDHPSCAVMVDGKQVTAVGRQSEVLEGFAQAYRWFMANRSVFSGLLAEIAGIPVRYLAHGTACYVRILQELAMPDAAGCWIRQEELINTLWPSGTDRRAASQAVFEHERLAILRGCIPVFECAADGYDLWTNGVCIENALRVTGADLVRERLAGLTMADLDFQSRLIKTALRLLEIQPGAKLDKRYSPLRAPEPGDDALRLLATRIGDRLAADVMGTDDQMWWLVGAEPDDGAYSIYCGGAGGLYDGVAGIALFAGFLELVCGTGRSLADRALGTMCAEVDGLVHRMSAGDLGRRGRLGLFSGLWGCVYAAACLGSCGWPGLLEWAAGVAGQVAEGVAEATEWDLIGGSCGIAAAAAGLALATGLDSFAVASRYALEAASRQLVPVLENGEIPVGMAHGLSGAAVALSRGACLFPNEGYEDGVRAVLAAEATQCFWDERGWRDSVGGRSEEGQRSKVESWCRGAGGIGLARESIRRLSRTASGVLAVDDAQLADEVALAVEVVSLRGFGGDQSLCHGAMGSVELVEARRAQRDMAGSLFGGIARWGMENEWVTGSPEQLPAPGLMTGLAGIGYGLLRRIDPGRVPNVLLLEAPKQDAGIRNIPRSDDAVSRRGSAT